MAKFLVTMFRDEDGVYVVECPAIPGCVSQGKSEAEAMRNIEDAIAGCLEVRGTQPVPNISVREVEVAI